MKAHSLYTGLYTDILIGVRGGTETRTSLFPWEETNANAELINDGSFVSNTRSWIDKDPYQQFTFNASLGYELRMYKGLSVNVGGFYNLGGLNLNENNSADEQTIFEPYFSDNTFSLDRFHFRAGLKWHFK